ncbi:leucine-rich melanocyte differentiation-associated protein-like [Clytia hemisphaerica]|uniref:Leucine rich repeat containing protein n=1 Tax=Clytia hemisphaerica TaxID=252671 RepID=A0A7M5X512_9CNID
MADEKDEEKMPDCFQNGCVSFIGQNVKCIPNWLSSKYGSKTIRADFSYNNLKSAKGLVGFDVLKELVLDNNCLTDDVQFPKLESLETLTANKNNIQNLELFMAHIVETLPNLTYLSLLGNTACPNQLSNLDNDEEDYQRYRYYVLYMMPNLKFLDSTPVSSSERKEALRIGAFTKVVSADNFEDNDEENSSSANEGYTPLPSSSTMNGEDDHKSTFGKCRYIYYGKHSEGNRFIANNDL